MTISGQSDCAADQLQTLNNAITRLPYYAARSDYPCRRAGHQDEVQPAEGTAPAGVDDRCWSTSSQRHSRCSRAPCTWSSATGPSRSGTASAAFPVNWVIQHEQLGTGHGVLQALPALSPDSTVLVLYGDVPLIGTETLASLVAAAAAGPALLTAQVSDPAGYGRILRDAAGALVGVVEHKDASAAQLEISEINTGLLAAPAADFMQYLPRVGNNNKQGEYYLPDILSMAVAEGRTVASCQAASELEVLGVNDRVQLNQLEREYQRRQAEQLMRSGVAVADANRLDIRGTLSCGRDVSIDVNVADRGRREPG